MIYYTIYKTTNQVNGKVYIGAHKTKNLNDNYLGSGKYLNYSIAKHSIENFTKEILYIFDNPEEMFNKEAELVTLEFIAEANTYNLKVGGMGGFDYINATGKNLYGKNGTSGYGLENLKIGREKVHRLWKEDKEWATAQSEKLSKQAKEDYASGKRKKTFLNKSHTQETKDIIGANSAKHQKGEGNSQYNTMWITNGTINKKIKKDATMPAGFKKGRVSKK